MASPFTSNWFEYRTNLKRKQITLHFDIITLSIASNCQLKSASFCILSSMLIR